MTEKSKQYRVGSWPRSGCYKRTSPPKLSEKQRAQIAELPYSIDNEQIDKIEVIYQQYKLEETAAVSNRGKKELDDKLKEINEVVSPLIESLKKLFEDGEVLTHLQYRQSELLGNELTVNSATIARNPSYYTTERIIRDLEHLKGTCDWVARRRGKRRPRGRTMPDYRFVVKLYWECGVITGTRPTMNPNGLLQRLIQILLKPGDLTGITRSVIEELKPDL